MKRRECEKKAGKKGGKEAGSGGSRKLEAGTFACDSQPSSSVIPLGRLWIKFCVSSAAATYTKAGGVLRRFGMALID